MTNRRELLVLSGAILASVAGCVGTPRSGPAFAGASDPDVDPDASEDRVDPDVDPGDLRTLVRGNTAFAFELLDGIVAEAPGDDHFVSPLSVSTALAMTWAGARGDTEAATADALEFRLDQDDLHPAFNELDRELDGRSDVSVDDGDPPELAVANALWPREGLDLREEFLDTMAAHYGARPVELDFADEPERSREVINDWVADETEDRIDELVPEDALDENTALVLTNAIYFLAGWAEEFDEDDTYDAEFTALDGSTGDVSMMSQSESFPYAEVDGHQLVELPYVGEETSMVVVLPAEGEFEAFERSLDADRLDGLLERLDDRYGTVELPRFEVDTSYELPGVLEELGMGIAFGPGADFGGMVEGHDVWIENVVHDTFVAVDEEGTEAAGATAVIVVDSGSPPVEFEVTVDRPFLFLIRDRPTDAVLFLGRVVGVPEEP